MIDLVFCDIYKYNIYIIDNIKNEHIFKIHTIN